MYFRGIIDEINYDPRTNQLEVVEFKTRASKTAPKPQQTFTHEIQVNIYRTLLDEIIQGQIEKKLYFERFHLDSSMILSESVQNEYKRQSFSSIETLENAFDLLKKIGFQIPTITTSKRKTICFLFDFSILKMSFCCFRWGNRIYSSNGFDMEKSKRIFS